jgi:hypothetical protein
VALLVGKANEKKLRKMLRKKLGENNQFAAFRRKSRKCFEVLAESPACKS